MDDLTESAEDVRPRGESPLVSIGLPVYNGEKHLAEALESLLGQDHRHIEVLISDNCSTDGTRAICQEAARRDARICYLRLDEPVSPLDNFNRLPPLGNGKYFMWAAHDDIREPTFVSRLVEILEMDPEAVLAFSRFDNIDEAGCMVRRYAEDWGRTFSRPLFAQFWKLALMDEGATQKANHIYGLVRRADLVAIGGMRHNDVDFSGEDVITLLRLLSRGRFVVADEVLFHYRVRARATRMKEPFFGYLVRRVLGSSPGHRGNLLTFLRRNHALHSGMRRAILRDAPLAGHEKLVLCLAAFLKEAVLPVRAVIASALSEIPG